MFVFQGKPYKSVEYEKARRLRREHGLPLKAIAARVGVSKSTVSLWTRDIELTDEQHHRNMCGPRGPADPAAVAARAARWSEKNRNRRRRSQREGRAKARTGDALHIAGCMLYWAEGSKSRNTVKLCNSDPNMVRFFRRFLTTCFDVTPEDFLLRLHVYTGNGITIQEIERYWLEVLDLPPEALRAHSINPLPTSSSGRKKNRLPYGVCTLQVRRSTYIVQHIYGAIQQYAGFEEPGWLDGPSPTPPRDEPQPADSGRAEAPSSS